MSNSTAQQTPPRYTLALVTWAGASGMITLITWVALPALTRRFRASLLAATPTPAQTAGSRPRFEELGARGASRQMIDPHDRVQG